MKFASLVMTLLIAAACGKTGGGSSSGLETKNGGDCSLNGRSVACAMTGEQNGIDLLEAMIDVPVKVEGTDITFLADKTSRSGGRRISCSVSVKNGEVYRFALRGRSLLLMTKEGSYELTRTADGEGLAGSWSWSGYEEGGLHLQRQITILGTSRVILRQSCEL